MRELGADKTAHARSTPTFAARLFTVLFPGSPAVNALLATLYISGPPNFLLALCPANIDPASLSIMVAFAVGGLMGDTLFHLLPRSSSARTAPTTPPSSSSSRTATSCWAPPSWPAS